MEAILTVFMYRTRSSSVKCVNSLRCLQQPIKRPPLHLHRRPHSSKTVVSFSHFLDKSKNNNFPIITMYVVYASQTCFALGEII